jgi:hypothetical protein
MQINWRILTSFAVASAVVAATRLEGQDSTRAQGAGAKDRQTFKVSGIVTDAGHEPIPAVEIVTLDSTGEAGRSATTDETGHFDLGRFGHGMLSLRARRMGYEQRTIQVEVGDLGLVAPVEIILLVLPEELENVTVSAAAPPTKLRGFYERSKQGRTFGKFFDQDRIRRLNPRSASELLRSVPGVTLSSNQSGGNAVRIRGCQPMVWLDDQRVPGAELDDLIMPSEIAAIEFYASNAGIPAQYLDRGNRLCGLILVWTKSG